MLLQLNWFFSTMHKSSNIFVVASSQLARLQAILADVLAHLWWKLYGQTGGGEHDEVDDNASVGTVASS